MYAHGFSHQPLSRGTQAGEKGCEVQRRLEQALEPRVGVGLAMADELEQTQLAVLSPHPSPHRGDEGGGQEDQQHPAVEITERAVRGRGGQRG